MKCQYFDIFDIILQIFLDNIYIFFNTGMEVKICLMLLPYKVPILVLSSLSFCTINVSLTQYWGNIGFLLQSVNIIVNVS